MEPLENSIEIQTISGARHRLDKEYRALRSEAGFAAMMDRLLVKISGEDRTTFMQGMCSNDVKKLAPGDAVAALLLTERAHVITEFYLLASEDALLIETDRRLWPRARQHLEKLLVADDVEIEECDNLCVVAILGPRARTIARTLAGQASDNLGLWRHAQNTEFIVANLPRFGMEAVSFIVDEKKVGGYLDALRHAAPEASQVDPGAIEIVRIENGVARVGIDATEKTLALEARLEPAISFNKGCYVGQETVERATARGALKKRLFGLRLEINPGSAVNAPVMLDGREVGRLSSFALSPRLGPIGLAMLHHSAWKAGTRLILKQTGGEIGASVSELPF